MKKNEHIPKKLSKQEDSPSQLSEFVNDLTYNSTQLSEIHYYPKEFFNIRKMNEPIYSRTILSLIQSIYSGNLNKSLINSD